jgi:hypothetical protein
MHIKERLCQSLMEDMSALHENFDRIWKIAQTMPAGGVRDDLEMTHQRMAQIIQNTKHGLMHDYSRPDLRQRR